MKLTEQNCQPCAVGTLPLSHEAAAGLLQEISGWSLGDDAIERTYKFRDFDEAMGFVNRVAESARREDHHPDIHISYNKVRLVLSTHKIGGLSNNDFILAAKIDAMDTQTRV
jgi:4a-hydroxytetrahydrobiopterin dehydratase